jgi:hypothetical protein
MWLPNERSRSNSIPVVCNGANNRAAAQLKCIVLARRMTTYPVTPRLITRSKRTSASKSRERAFTRHVRRSRCVAFQRSRTAPACRSLTETRSLLQIVQSWLCDFPRLRARDAAVRARRWRSAQSPQFLVPIVFGFVWQEVSSRPAPTSRAGATIVVTSRRVVKLTISSIKIAFITVGSRDHCNSSVCSGLCGRGGTKVQSPLASRAGIRLDPPDTSPP